MLGMRWSEMIMSQSMLSRNSRASAPLLAENTLYSRRSTRSSSRRLSGSSSTTRMEYFFDTGAPIPTYEADWRRLVHRLIQAWWGVNLAATAIMAYHGPSRRPSVGSHPSYPTGAPYDNRH